MDNKQMSFSSIAKTTNKKWTQAIWAGQITGLTTLTLGAYLFTGLRLFSYADRLGIDDVDSLRPHYFDGEPFLPMFKYFVWPIIFFLISLRLVFTSNTRIVAISAFMLAVWLTLSSLQTYYGHMNFYLAFTMGCILDLITVILFVLLIIRADPQSKPSVSQNG